jgi:hypothetical protein
LDSNVIWWQISDIYKELNWQWLKDINKALKIMKNYYKFITFKLDAKNYNIEI